MSVWRAADPNRARKDLVELSPEFSSRVTPHHAPPNPSRIHCCPRAFPPRSERPPSSAQIGWVFRPPDEDTSSMARASGAGGRSVLQRGVGERPPSALEG